MNSGESSGSSWVLLLSTGGTGWCASGLSKGIGVLIPGGPGILCRFFPLDVSPTLNTSISSRVNFLRW